MHHLSHLFEKIYIILRIRSCLYCTFCIALCTFVAPRYRQYILRFSSSCFCIAIFVLEF
jgi:hypothetical protein